LIELDAGALDLARFVRAGDTVVIAQGSAEPLTLTEALVAQADQIGPLTAFIGATYSDTFAPDRAPSIDYASYGAIGTNARLARASRLRVVPCHYSQLPWLFASGTWRADVVLLGLSRTVDGRATLGAAHGFALAAASNARVVLAEVNEQTPWMYGGELPESVRIGAVVRSARPLPRYPRGTLADVERAVAANVAALIPDGATLQVGVGGVPDAVLDALRDHRELRLHSGMLTSAALPLIARGTATGVTVTGILIGDERLYAHADRNAGMRLAGPEHTHDIGVIARLPRFVSVNSAVEVDLHGRVNAESAGGSYVGAVGGQIDFIRGAAAANGRAIIALPSVSRDVKASRIVASCATVTTPAADADTIVTEWGAAELRGVPYDERARRMIAIAHPNFREPLAAAARVLP
jgi:acyl-CoA hydrolase